MKKSGFLTFCFAFLPGCGQMYQGYMRRGASLLVWFFAIIFLSVFINMGALLFALPIIWAYSFFDTFNIRALSEEQRASFRDDFIPSAAWLQSIGFKNRQDGNKNARIVGGVLVALGVLMLFRTFLWDFIDWALRYVPFLGKMLSNLPSAVLAIGIIVLGVWLLRGKNNNSGPAPDDVVPFKGEDPGAPQ